MKPFLDAFMKIIRKGERNPSIDNNPNIKIKIIRTDGSIVLINISKISTGLDVILASLDEFSNPKPSAHGLIKQSREYKLMKVNGILEIKSSATLESVGVLNNDELLLYEKVKYSASSKKRRYLRGPTKSQIDIVSRKYLEDIEKTDEKVNSDNNHKIGSTTV